ncbi:MAG TPA: YdcF family protein [Polyangiaceae bacterium]
MERLAPAGSRRSFTKIARRAALSAALLGAFWVLAACGVDLYGRTLQPHGKWDAIVVAGATVWRGGRPSRALTRRTLAGVELFRQGYAPRLVLTGGVGAHGPAEAEVAARIAREHGVPEAALVIEGRSHNTEENARFARELIGSGRVLVVTDAYHALRSELIYRRYFEDVALVGLPIGKTPALASGALREVPALLWHWITAPFR